MSRCIECVPNFSEGRDREVVDRIRQALLGGAGVALLDDTMDADHHRSVFTLAGSPQDVSKAILRAAEVAVEAIDLRSHRGVHPRIGALDVVPLVPLEAMTPQECVTWAHALGQKLWSRLKIPVYFYGEAAQRKERRRLEQVRRGAFEGLLSSAAADSERPDVGGPQPHPTAGATAIGVRKILIAYNIDLETSDPAIAKQIARGIRESSGGLPYVKALGLELPSRGRTQVSMNLTDYEQTPPHVVLQRVKREAERLGTRVVGSEIIGLIPRKALEMALAHGLELEGFRPGVVLEDRLAEATRSKSGKGQA